MTSMSETDTQTPPQRLIGEKAQRLFFLVPESVEFIEADGNYVIIHAAGTQYISRNTLKHLSEILAPLGFVRIGRSLLVNMAQVAYGERLGRGALALTLNSGRQLVSTPAYRKRILR